MFYTYILYSDRYDRYYTGHAEDLKARLTRHNNKMVSATKNFAPWRIVYYEEFEEKILAITRELEIKKKKSRKYIEFLLNSGTGRHVPI
jgi:putative endonuclease